MEFGVVASVHSGASTTVVVLYSAAAVVIASVISGLFTSRSAGKTNVAIRQEASESRKQQRIQDAYVEIQIYITEWTRYVDQRLNARPGQELPQRPMISDQAQAIADLVGATAVRNAMLAFTKDVAMFRITLLRLDGAQEQKEMAHPGLGGELDESKAEVASKARAVRITAERVREAMAKDLNGPEPPVRVD